MQSCNGDVTDFNKDGDYDVTTTHIYTAISHDDLLIGKDSYTTIQPTTSSQLRKS